MPPVTCEIISDLAQLTGWQETTIENMPLHRALYYQLKAANLRGVMCQWSL